MEKSVQELAEFLKGTVEHDNPELRITGVNGLVEAGPEGYFLCGAAACRALSSQQGWRNGSQSRRPGA